MTLAKWTNFMIIVDLLDKDTLNELKPAIIKAYILKLSPLILREDLHDVCAAVAGKLFLNLRFKYVDSDKLFDIGKLLFDKFNCDVCCILVDDERNRMVSYYCLEDELEEWGIDEGGNENSSEQISA
jgi:hypothetical protein